MHGVDGTWISRESSASVTALIPKLLSMFGNIETTSQETRRVRLGNGPSLFRSSIFCNRWVVSLTKEGNSWANGLW